MSININRFDGSVKVILNLGLKTFFDFLAHTLEVIPLLFGHLDLLVINEESYGIGGIGKVANYALDNFGLYMHGRDGEDI